MSSDSTMPVALLLDIQERADPSLLAALDGWPFRQIRATTLTQAVALLVDPAVALVVVPWPQAGLSPDAARACLSPYTANVLLLHDGDAPPALVEPERLYHARPSDAPAWLRLFGQLALSQQALTRARHQLYASARSVVLGDLIGGVAHDLNNPLTAILGNAELLPPQPSDDDQQGVQQIVLSARRVQSLVYTLLVIARSIEGQQQWFDPAAVINGALDLQLAVLRSKQITHRVELAPGLPQIWGEGGQLQQALLHLLHNAVQALEQIDGERLLMVRARRSATDQGDALVIELADNGPGLPDAPPELLFEPFWSTRPTGKGAGLGLTVAREIVGRARGTIEVFTPETSGAGFRIVLPVRLPDDWLALGAYDHDGRES